MKRPRCSQKKHASRNWHVVERDSSFRGAHLAGSKRLGGMAVISFAQTSSQRCRGKECRGPDADDPAANPASPVPITRSLQTGRSLQEPLAEDHPQSTQIWRRMSAQVQHYSALRNLSSILVESRAREEHAYEINSFRGYLSHAAYLLSCSIRLLIMRFRSVSVWRSSSILAIECITVVWCLSPK